MTLEMFSGILILLAIIIVPCIPGLWLAYCLVRDVIKVLKEGLDEYVESEERIKFVDEYLQEQLEKQETIAEMGFAAYYINQAKHFWKEYSFVFYAIGMILLLAAAVFRRGIAFVLVSLRHVPLADIAAVFVTVLEILVLLYYILCKKHRRKWKAAIALLMIIAVKQIVALAFGSFNISVDTALYLMLFLAVHHYEQWKRELAAHTEALHQKLTEEQYAEDALISKYFLLLQHREAIGERPTVFTRLRDDDEIDEMNHYVTWLAQRESAEDREEVTV